MSTNLSLNELKESYNITSSDWADLMECSLTEIYGALWTAEKKVVNSSEVSWTGNIYGETKEVIDLTINDRVFRFWRNVQRYYQGREERMRSNHKA